jgi:hypothetical protein
MLQMLEQEEVTLMDELTLGILGFGLFTVWLGVMVRIGKLRWLFFGGSFPVLSPVGVFLIAVPIGLGIVTIGLKIVFPEWKLLIPMAIFFLTGVILSLWAPDWILPRWMSWLMNNYEHVLPEMIEEVRQIGAIKWERETRTQAELERWADRVAQKHGWQRLDHINEIAHAWREIARRRGISIKEGPPTQAEIEQLTGEGNWRPLHETEHMGEKIPDKVAEQLRKGGGMIWKKKTPPKQS